MVHGQLQQLLSVLWSQENEGLNYGWIHINCVNLANSLTSPDFVTSV